MSDQLLLSMTEHAVFRCGPWSIDIDVSGVWTLEREESHHALEVSDLRCLGAVVSAAHAWRGRSGPSGEGT